MEELRAKTLELLNNNTEVEEKAWKFWNNIKNPDLLNPIQHYKNIMATIIESHKNNTFDISNFPTTIIEFNKKRWENFSDSRPSQKAKVEQATTDMFQCGRCKQRKCTYHTAQIRSGDEAATIFIQCQNCGLNFRM